LGRPAKFNDDNAVDRYLGNPTQAMDILADAEDLFSQQVEKPLHIPRPQPMILNLLMKWKTYMSSPVNAVSVLFGRPYPLSDYSDTDKFREFDKGHLLEQAEDYARFYLSGWDYFLSGYSDYKAAKDSLSAGLNVLSRSIQIANGL
jgi:hypothetical protein